MKNINYILKNIRVYIISIFITSIMLVAMSLFIDDFNINNKFYKSLKNTNLDFISYDILSEEKDSYEFFSNTLDVNFENSGLLNTYVYQLMEDVVYTNKSPINKNNLINSNDGILNSNEAAIPDYYQTKYKVKVGDYIYVNGEPIKIKLIFSDVDLIYDVNHKTTSKIIFIGANTIGEETSVYANFDPSIETHHYQMKNINKVVNNIKSKLDKTIFLVILLSFINGLFVLYFKFKAQVKTLNIMRINGAKKIFLDIILIESTYLTVVSLFLFMSTFWNKYFSLLLYSIFGVMISVVVYVLLISLSVRERRRWKHQFWKLKI